MAQFQPHENPFVEKIPGNLNWNLRWELKLKNDWNDQTQFTKFRLYIFSLSGARLMFSEWGEIFSCFETIFVHASDHWYDTLKSELMKGSIDPIKEDITY